VDTLTVPPDPTQNVLQRPVKAEERAILAATGAMRLLSQVSRFARPVFWVALVMFAFVLVRTAWLCDDAYITFRTVYNFVNGFGPTWNAAERVQAFAHPLWMLLLSGFYALTREMYFTPLVLSLAASLTAAWLFAFKVARTPGGAVLGLFVWIGSRAFMDYSTGGLENPLAHVLLLCTFLGLSHGWQAIHLGLLTSGLLLLRTDLALVVLPGLVYWFRSGEGGPAKTRSFLLGLLPLFLWHAFALFYYGALLPNPAVAKLNSGAGLKGLFGQGLTYLGDSIRFDPLTLPAIVLGFIAAMWLSWRQRIMASGILLYLLYVVCTGGDSMSGRFLDFALVWAMAFAVRALERVPNVVEWVLTLPVLVTGLFAAHPSLTSGSDYGLDRGNDFEDAKKAAKEIIGEDGIADQRAWDYRLTGLWRVELDGLRPIPPLAAHPRYQEVQKQVASGKKVVTATAIGLRGFYLGPGVHVIDECGLADPLLARLSATSGDWRRTRFERKLPSGYEKSVESGENKLKDEGLGKAYESIKLVTRGSLSSGARLWEIVRLNTGRLRGAIAAYEKD
jgi:arabinofuranosyltransferase